MTTVNDHFEGKEPRVRQIYDELLRASRALGAVEEDPKKTSIHLARRTAFAGVATRRDAVILTLKSATDIASPRIHRREQASANRWHLEIRLREPKEIDRELESWLKSAYELAG